MDKILPPEMLIKIFMTCYVDDIQSISDTCKHWQNIIKSYKIWEAHWLRLLDTGSKTNLGESLCSSLKKCKSSDIDLKHSCICLKNILYNEQNQIYKCLLNNNVRKFEFGVLKTLYNEVTLTLVLNDMVSQRNNIIIKRKNDSPPNCKSYLLFRSPPKLLEAIDYVFNAGGHAHVQQLMYMYPLGLTQHMGTVVARLLEAAHVEDLVLIPRVLALCEHLEVSDAVVVYSTSRSTEVAVVVGGRVAPGRFTELPVGGWQVAQNLHSTFHWLHPGVPLDPARFDTPTFKKRCFLKMSNWFSDTTMSDRFSNTTNILHEAGIYSDTSASAIRDTLQLQQDFLLKDEKFLAPELMYKEMNLCEVIARLTTGLSDAVLGRCLSHVLLAGGNCQMKFFNVRIRLDLKKRWPLHASIINTSVHTSRTLAYTPPFNFYEPLFLPAGSTFLFGQPCRITRELYITKTYA